MPPLLLAPSRIWITAEPHPQFPIGLLQMGIKITNEAPVGMKAGLRASYQWVNQDMLDAVSRFEWRQLLFAMCFLHSVVQERRKFGPIGWNVPYEFNASDLSACTQFLQVRRDPRGGGGRATMEGVGAAGYVGGQVWPEAGGKGQQQSWHCMWGACPPWGRGWSV